MTIILSVLNRFKNFFLEDSLVNLQLNGYEWVFTLADNTRGIRGHWKLVKFRCTDFCIFWNRVINRRNQLDQRVVDASSINAFEGCLKKNKGNKGGLLRRQIRRALGLPSGFSGWWGHTRWVTRLSDTKHPTTPCICCYKVHETITFLLVTLPNIHRFLNFFSLTDSAINLS